MSLGGQTVRLTPRIRGKHNSYTDGPVQVYPGCAVQPVTSSDRGEDGSTQARWKLFAPPGFPERSTGVITVDGITDDAGSPRRLHIDGELQTHVDLDGAPEYVGGFLTEWRG